MLKTCCVNGKALQIPCVKTLQNITDYGSFQNFKFNYVGRVKITICNNAVIWSDKQKVIGYVKSRFQDDLHQDILQAAYIVLNSWTVTRRSLSKNIVAVATTSTVIMTTSKVMMTTASIVTMTTRMT